MNRIRLVITGHVMKAAKIISLDNYRATRHGPPRKSPKGGAGFQLPSADRLWELLDRNINISVWLEHN